MLRSGYTNVIPKLSSIKRLSQYSFEMFTVVNIQKLFQEGDNHLKNFDCLIVTTNATSDKTVLTSLQSNKQTIEDFIFKGKGVFVASQKKLSSENSDIKKEEGKTKFLPDLYEFLTVEMQYYLPSVTYCNYEWLREIWSGKRKVRFAS